MSSFRRWTRNPDGEWELADWTYDWFGRHRYAVVFPSDPGTTHPKSEREWETSEEKPEGAGIARHLGEPTPPNKTE